jgi:phage baseplate assembly protein gpV
MAGALLDWLAGVAGEGHHEGSGFAIAPGIVTNNFDLLAEGRVQVRVPAHPAFDPWARLAAAGAGPDRGFLWVPELDDEVLVAFNQNDERDAYILGGLWSTLRRTPVTLPTDFLVKRVIRTGKSVKAVASPVAHEIELNDLDQSITITSSTMQKVTIDPTKIKLETTGGTVSVVLDLTSQTVSILAPNKIEFTSKEITLTGATINLQGGRINLQAAADCTIQGLAVKINS